MKFDRVEKNTLKLLSLVLAICFWFYVLSTEQTLVVKSFPVKFAFPENKTLLAPQHPEVQVTLKGPQVFMRALLDREDQVFLDLNKIRPIKRDTYKVRIQASDIPVPLGVDIQKIHNGTFTVVVDAFAKKSVPLDVPLTGKVEADHRLIQGSVEPKVIEVAGPKKILRKINSLQTSVIDLTKLVGQGKKEVEIVGLDSRVKMNVLGPLFYKYDIRPTKSNLVLENIKVRFLTSRKVIRTSHRTVDLKVLSVKDEKDVDRTSLHVVADIPEKEKGKISVKLKAILPEGIQLLEIIPEDIEVTIR